MKRQPSPGRNSRLRATRRRKLPTLSPPPTAAPTRRSRRGAAQPAPAPAKPGKAPPLSDAQTAALKKDFETARALVRDANKFKTEGDAILKIGKVLYPQKGVPDAVYAVLAKDRDETVGKDPESAQLLGEGGAALDQIGSAT